MDAFSRMVLAREAPFLTVWHNPNVTRGTKPKKELFFTDFLTAHIRAHPTGGKAGRPLFAYASYQSVHGPLEVPKRFFDLYVVAEPGGCVGLIFSRQA